MNWLSTYLEYTQHMESPRLYHQWAAICIIGHVLGRKVWMSRGGMYTIYPGQLMVVLVGRSALVRKTTAINIATKMIEKLKSEDVFILPKKLSPQELCNQLARFGSDGEPLRDPRIDKRLPGMGLIVAPELSTFFTAESFAESLAGHVNDFNDAPKGLKPIRFRKWAVDLYYPCVGLIGGITPKGIAEELPRTCRSAGFFGRILWVYCDDTTRINALTETPPDLKALRKVLMDDLQRICEMRGPMVLSPKAKRWYDNWYTTQHVPALRERNLGGIEVKDTGYWGRRGDHLLRVAMVLSAMSPTQVGSENGARPQYLVRERHLVEALGLLKDIEGRFDKAFIEIGTSPTMEYDMRVLDILAKHPVGCPRWKLQKTLLRFGSSNRLEQAKDNLVAARYLKVVRRDGEEYWSLRKRKVPHA